MNARRMTVAQAIVEFLGRQYTVDRIDGVEQRIRLISGMFGIFGHGNLAGIGHALAQRSDLLPFHQGYNEQALSHQAVGFARHTRRRQTYAVTTSIGPGATNLLTGAALATANRLPVLLFPGDTFATRVADPVLQQIEQPYAHDVTVNDAFRPLSKYFDRVHRPEQVFSALLNGMRVLTDPAETGAVTIALPQDVAVEALDVPADFLAEREWRIRRPEPESADIAAAAAQIRAARAPLVIAGGGVLYAFAPDVLREFASATGIPVGWTQAGTGSLPWDHPQALGAIGSTGTTAANAYARDADLVIGIGTRYEDFTTASRTLFQNPAVRFVNINVAPIDAYKHGTSLPLVADARKALVQLQTALQGYRAHDDASAAMAAHKARWAAAVDSAFADPRAPLVTQSAVIGALQRVMAPEDVVVAAAGSLPGELHKLWRVRDPWGYHVEYAYSCMGYEIPGGLGVKRAAGAARDVVVLVGDGSYLMMNSELITAVAEGIKLIVIVLQNHGYASIGALSESVGSARFGTTFRAHDGSILPVDLAANAQSLGARVIRIAAGPGTVADLEAAVAEAKAAPESAGPIVIHVDTDPYVGAPDSESWWDVPVSVVSDNEPTQAARQAYVENKALQRPLFGPGSAER